VRGHRSWAARALADVAAALAVAEGATPVDVNRMLRGFKSEFTDTTHAGDLILFQGRAGTGDVVITGTSPAFFLGWQLFWGVVAFLGAALALRAGAKSVGRLPVFCGLALVLIALLIPAGYGSAHVFTAMLLGVLGAGVVSFLGWLRTTWGTSRTVAGGPDVPDVPGPDAPAPQGGAA
jgi:hypothetical protein